MENKNIRRCGPANSFDRKYLEANLVGEDHRGSKVTAVTSKYIYTENTKYEKKGYRISFVEKEGTEKYIIPDTSGETEGDRC